MPLPQPSRAPTKAWPSTKKCRQCFSNNKAAFCAWVLVVSYTFVDNSVSSQLMDSLTGSLKNQRIAAIITNLQDGLSSLSLVIAYLISEAYTGRFTVVAFCSSASIMGGSMSEDFLDYQLGEKVVRVNKKERKPEQHNKGRDNARKQEDLKTNNKKQSQVICFCGHLTGYAIVAIFALLGDDDEDGDVGQHSIIGIGSLLMVGTYLLFYFGYAWYRHENLAEESNVGKIYRIYKAAYKKRRFRYPTSENGYYWKNYKQNHFYEDNRRSRGVRLLPRVPQLFAWLDKAAIIREQSAGHDLSPLQQEMKGELCTVKEAREMKIVGLLICWGFTFFAYNLVLASGNTLFVSQAFNLRDFTGNDLAILFIVRSIVSDILPILRWLFKRTGIVKMAKNWMINFGFKRTDATVLRISIGMVCAVICCFLAWHVEVRRLYMIKKEGILQNPDREISMGTVALVPQFLMLGIAEGLAADGLGELFQGYASKTTSTFDSSISQLVIGVGKLFMIPAILIFSSWFQESFNTGRLDKYFLRLAVLNIVFHLLFVFYYFKYAYKNQFPEDEEIEMEQTLLEHGHRQADLEEANAREENFSIVEVPVVSEEGHANQAESEEVNASEEYFINWGRANALRRGFRPGK